MGGVTMYLSVLFPRKLTADEKEKMMLLLRENGFERSGQGAWRSCGSLSLSLCLEENPREDPFWVSLTLDDLYFLPLDEILLTSGGDTRSDEEMYRLAADLSDRLRGVIYDHQAGRVYGPGGRVPEEHGPAGGAVEYGALLRKDSKKEDR